MRKLTAAQEHGHRMRAQGHEYRGGYTRDELIDGVRIPETIRDEKINRRCGVRVYVIVAACKGCVESVAVRSTQNEATKTRNDYDKFYDIIRDEGGCAENENDVVVYDCEVDGNDGDVIL